MRDKNFDVDLMKTLNDQPMPETPLADDEFTRVLDAACGRLPQKKPAGHRRFPWGRAAAAAAACLAVGLGSINFAAPAVAEQLPVVGSLFSWLNRGGQDDYVSLQSEQLNKYAETVESTAETADSPYTLTLGQVFNDGDWLRISLMLTSEDDSLAGFNAIGPREDAVEKAMQNGGGQYGTLVLDNGIELSGGINFEKRDDHTFVAGLNYELFLTNEDLAGHTATLTLSDLVACNRSTVETDGKSYWHYDYADQTPLPGTYTLTFTIPEASDAGVRTMSTPVEQDGVTLQSIKATPAATKVLLTFPPEQHWVSVKLYTADGTELGHERGEGGWWTDGAWTADPADFDHPEQCTKASYDYFAAVPENCHSLTVKVYDFDTDAELTTFTAEHASITRERRQRNTSPSSGPAGPPAPLLALRATSPVPGESVPRGKAGNHSITSHPGKYHSRISRHVLPSSAIAFAPYWLRPTPWP